MNKVTRRTAITGALAAAATPGNAVSAKEDESSEYARGYHKAMRDVTEFLDKLKGERIDDPVVTMCDDWWRLTHQWESYWDDHQDESEEEAAIWDARHKVLVMLSQTPAISTRGVVAQLRVLMRDEQDTLEDRAKTFLSTILSGLEARTGE